MSTRKKSPLVTVKLHTAKLNRIVKWWRDEQPPPLPVSVWDALNTLVVAAEAKVRRKKTR